LQKVSANAVSVKKALAALAVPKHASDLERFFKTGPGEYGEGDIFIGVTVPQSRSVAKQFLNLPLNELQKLAKSKIHQERFVAEIILQNYFEKAKLQKDRKIFFDIWMDWLYAGYVNNWDLVDVVGFRFGTFLHDQTNYMNLLKKLAKSKVLWERRTAMIFAGSFIRTGQFQPTLEIADVLIDDEHDLIHKAVGWMLREVGKRDVQVLRQFLSDYAATMPRTALRYAIEKLPESERKRWLAAKNA
jgi:3-methyladenine DNA glycosylase AlkD